MQLALSLDFFQRVDIGGGSVVTVIAVIVRGRGIIAAAGRQSQYHHQSHQHRNQFFHVHFHPFLILSRAGAFWVDWFSSGGASLVDIAYFITKYSLCQAYL